MLVNMKKLHNVYNGCINFFMNLESLIEAYNKSYSQKNKQKNTLSSNEWQEIVQVFLAIAH